MGWIRRETEKGTTQYICPNCHDYHEFREDFGEQTFNENFIFCRRCGARNGTGTAPTLPPPNEPLTLKQLRERNKPVWCSCKPIEGGNGYWCLCQYGQIIAPSGNIFDVEEILHWVFYNSPPEVSP